MRNVYLSPGVHCSVVHFLEKKNTLKESMPITMSLKLQIRYLETHILIS